MTLVKVKVKRRRKRGLRQTFCVDFQCFVTQSVSTKVTLPVVKFQSSIEEGQILVINVSVVVAPESVKKKFVLDLVVVTHWNCS